MSVLDELSLSEYAELFSDAPVELTHADWMLVTALTPVENVELASKGRLDRSPKANWVEKAGGLPSFIEDVAVELHKKGMDISRAIATAISRIKKWAATGTAKTKAKAVAALAQWAKMRAKNKAKKATKAKLSNGREAACYQMVELSFNMDTVREAFSALERDRHEAARQLDTFLPYRYVEAVWSDFIIVRDEETDKRVRISYSADESGVDFGKAEPGHYEFVLDEDASDEEYASLSGGPIDILALSYGDPQTVWADSQARRYPIATPEDVKVSCAALTGATASPEVKARIREAAKFFQVA